MQGKEKIKEIDHRISELFSSTQNSGKKPCLTDQINHYTDWVNRRWSVQEGVKQVQKLPSLWRQFVWVFSESGREKYRKALDQSVSSLQEKIPSFCQAEDLLVSLSCFLDQSQQVRTDEQIAKLIKKGKEQISSETISSNFCEFVQQYQSVRENQLLFDLKNSLGEDSVKYLGEDWKNLDLLEKIQFLSSKLEAFTIQAEQMGKALGLFKSWKSASEERKSVAKQVIAKSILAAHDALKEKKVEYPLQTVDVAGSDIVIHIRISGDPQELRISRDAKSDESHEGSFKKYYPAIGWNAIDFLALLAFHPENDPEKAKKQQEEIEREVQVHQDLLKHKVRNIPGKLSLYQGGIYVERGSGSLKDSWRVQRGRVLNQADINTVIRDIAEALVDMHKIGYLHLDLKADNVQLVRDEKGNIEGAMVIDFGFTEKINDQGFVKRSLTTASVMSPEMFLQGKPGKPADLYSLGSIIYRALSSKSPGEKSYNALSLKQKQKIESEILIQRIALATKQDCPKQIQDQIRQYAESGENLEEIVTKLEQYHKNPKTSRYNQWVPYFSYAKKCIYEDEKSYRKEFVYWRAGLSGSELLVQFAKELSLPSTKKLEDIEHLGVDDFFENLFKEKKDKDLPLSKELLKAVFLCVHPDPQKRPTAEELVLKIFS